MPERVLRKYGEQAIIDFTLFDTTNGSFKTDATHETGDTKISMDEGAEVDTTNGFVDNGTGYSLTLEATEMTAKRLFVPIVDQYTKQWRDEYLMIETFGHTDAQQAFNLDADLSTNTETWNFKAIDIHNDAGFGLTVTSDTTTAVQLRAGGNGDGLDSSGCGTGHAFNLRAGARGHAISAVAIGTISPAVKGHGLHVESEAEGYGINVLGGNEIGESSGYGMNIESRKGSPALRIQGAVGNAGVLIAAGTNADGVDIRGNGGGNGMIIRGGSSGSGLILNGNGNGHGLRAYVSGSGTGSGIYAVGSTTGHGIQGVGGSSSGDGMRLTGGTDGYGLSAQGVGKEGAYILGSGNEAGMKVRGSNNGHGLYLDGGNSGGTGLYIRGNSTGHGIYSQGGPNAHGFYARGGLGTGSGIVAVGDPGGGHGLWLLGQGGGRDLYADEIGPVLSTFDGTATPGIIQMLGAMSDQNSGSSYDSATSSLTTISQGTGGTVDANVIQIDGQATNGNNATLNLKQLNIVNSSGTAIIAHSTGGNGHGLDTSGTGTGHGIYTTGTNGIYTQAASPGAGILAVGSGGAGFEATGDGTFAGVWAKGGINGHGIEAISGDDTGSGIYAYGAGVGHGMEVKSDNTGSGIYAHSSGIGQGIYALGGTTNGHGMYLAAATSGAGLYIKGRLDDGMKVFGGGNGHGLSLTGAGTGLGISTAEIGTPPTIFDGTATPGIYAMLTAMSDSSGGSDFTSVANSLVAISLGSGGGGGGDGTDVNVVAINGQSTSGNNATLNLKQLNIINDSGSALVAYSTGGNGHGLDASGNGSGDGFNSIGGATGLGINAAEIGTPPATFDGTATPSMYAMLTAMSDSSGGSDFVSVNDSLTAISIAANSVTGTVDANLIQIDGQATTGNNATLNLKQLNIVNNAGTALIAHSTGGNGHGMDASGNGTGAGFLSVGGATGLGINAPEIGLPPTIFDGTATPSMYAMLTAMSDSSGGSNFVAVNDSLAAISIAANTVTPSDGTDVNLVSIDGQLTSGNNATLNLKQLNIINNGGTALVARSNGGNGYGIESTGNGTGTGLYVIGGATGKGAEILGGGGGQIALSVRSTTANAAEFLAGTSGIGLKVVGAGTDHGAQFLGGASGGDGFYVAAQGGNGNGASFHKAGSGKDMDAEQLDGLLKLTTTVDGQPLSYVYELMMSRVNGKFDTDIPSVNKLTMYKRDDLTPLTVVDIQPSGRTRDS